MFTVDVRSNAAAFIEQMKTVYADGVRIATYRALNKVAPQVRTAAIAGIRATYKLTASTVRKQFSIRKAGPGNLSASVITSGRPLPLMAFAAKQVKGVVSVNVKGTRKVVEGAFIATMPNGKALVFMRAPGARTESRKGKRTALPIDQKFGISLPLTVTGPAINDAMVKVVDEKFPERLVHEFTRIAKQKGFL